MNVAFVGPAEHRITRSTQFLIDLMKRAWPHTKVLTSDWSWAQLTKSSTWDVVVFFQRIPDRRLLDSLTIKSVILVPMYDDWHSERAFWDQYTDCGVLCFCNAMADQLERWSLRVHRAQYFPEVPPETVDWSLGARRAFFWLRKPDLGWSIARQLLRDTDWSEVHVHTDNVPGRTSDIAMADRQRFHILESRWFANGAKFRRALARSQVFLAPRRTEGIGMSVLEAMALGMMVVAADAPTMNEYIESGVNGFLYDPDRPARPPWEDAARLGRAARETAIQGRERWLANHGALIDFLRDPGLRRSPGRMLLSSEQAVRAARRQYRKSQILTLLRWVRRPVTAVLRPKEKAALLKVLRRLAG